MGFVGDVFLGVRRGYFRVYMLFWADGVGSWFETTDSCVLWGWVSNHDALLHSANSSAIVERFRND